MKRVKTIWVFRTSVFTSIDMHMLKPMLDRLLQAEDKWNFDLEDCDHILRVETWSLPATTIIDTLENAGFRCEELEDLPPLPIRTIFSNETDHTLAVNAMCRN